MTLWFVLSLMTAAAVFAVLQPLARRAPLRSGSDVAVYRDQLQEIDRDRTAGLIGEREAEAARIEVSRRLIGAADAEAPAASVDRTGRRRVAALIALVLLPLGAAGTYLMSGSPHLPAQPLSARLDRPPADAPGERSIADLVGRVEAHLEANPEDGRGWEVLAPVYMRLNRYEDAVKARRNILRLLGEDAVRHSDLGEALTGVANGIVTADAKAAFERALRHDPNEFKARYFLGLAAEQDGRPNEAANVWRELLAGAPPDAPWTGFIRESLLRVDPSTPMPAGPTADDVAAASQLSPEQRTEFVRGMVERLAERLQREGSDVDGWLRLLRAYMVLGDRDKARAAAGDARRALASEPDKLRQIDELVKGLGLEG